MRKHKMLVTYGPHTAVPTKQNVQDILEKEIGIVFSKALEHAGVYRCDGQGKAEYERLVYYVNEQKDR